MGMHGITGIYIYNGTDGGRHVFCKTKLHSLETLLLANHEIIQLDRNEIPHERLEWVADPLLMRERYRVIPSEQGKYKVIRIWALSYRMWAISAMQCCIIIKFCTKRLVMLSIFYHFRLCVLCTVLSSFKINIMQRADFDLKSGTNLQILLQFSMHHDVSSA